VFDSVLQSTQLFVFITFLVGSRLYKLREEKTWLLLCIKWQQVQMSWDLTFFLPDFNFAFKNKNVVFHVKQFWIFYFYLKLLTEILKRVKIVKNKLDNYFNVTILFQIFGSITCLMLSREVASLYMARKNITRTSQKMSLISTRSNW
jgi:hypothetical protein